MGSPRWLLKLEATFKLFGMHLGASYLSAPSWVSGQMFWCKIKISSSLIPGLHPQVQPSEVILLLCTQLTLLESILKGDFLNHLYWELPKGRQCAESILLVSSHLGHSLTSEFLKVIRRLLEQHLPIETVQATYVILNFLVATFLKVKNRCS